MAWDAKSLQVFRGFAVEMGIGSMRGLTAGTRLVALANAGAPFLDGFPLVFPGRAVQILPVAGICGPLDRHSRHTTPPSPAAYSSRFHQHSTQQGIPVVKVRRKKSRHAGPAET